MAVVVVAAAIVVAAQVGNVSGVALVLTPFQTPSGPWLDRGRRRHFALSSPAHLELRILHINISKSITHYYFK